jgi:flagellar hook protein FlgE
VGAYFQMFNISVMGMSAQSDALANISENIANNNTVGYKRATTHFLTVLSGFQGPMQAGGGVSTNTHYDIDGKGSLVGTNSSTDLAIRGNGFFVVTDDSGSTFLTRSGAFTPNANGNLVNTAGYYLMGFSTDTTGTVTSGGTSLSNMEKIQVRKDKLYSNPTSRGSISTNLPADAAIVAPANLPSANSATASYAAKTSATVFDNLGDKKSVDVYYAKTASNTWEATVFNTADATSGGFPYANAPLTTQTLTFDPANGSLLTGSPMTLTIPNGQSTSIDVSNTTQLGAPFIVNNMNMDGNAPSAISKIDVNSDGVLRYLLDNGQTVPAYQIGVANVDAPTELMNYSGNVYVANSRSGQILVGKPGQGSLGGIQSSSLESSMVDLATELSSMIIAQRSFAANSQTFQAASEILQILNNLK